MNTVYTTETPIIASHKYHFDYHSKRDAYVDGCYACLGLNQVAKSAPDNYRHYLYRLKNRWIEMLYRRGFCVRAELGERQVWQLVFLVDGVKFQWHLPGQVITWPIKENHAPVYYEWQDDLPMRTRPLEESVALLEWVLSKG
jgi:hypothetical protein